MVGGMLTVGELRRAIDGISDDTLVIVDGYEIGADDAYVNIGVRVAIGGGSGGVCGRHEVIDYDEGEMHYDDVRSVVYIGRRAEGEE